MLDSTEILAELLAVRKRQLLISAIGITAVCASILISGHWFYTALNSVCPEDEGSVEYQSASLDLRHL